MMRALVTEAQCLKCHARQGDRVGDIRGGVSVSIPLAPYLAQRNRDMLVHVFSFGFLWLVGGAGILGMTRRLSQRLSERDRAEELLRRSRQNYSTLVDSSLTGIYISQDDVIRFGNARFAEIHGYTADEIIGADAGSLVHPEDRSAVPLLTDRSRPREKPKERYEVRCITKEGRTIWVQRRCTVIDYNGGQAVLGNEIDITQQKMAETELKASQEQLKRLSARLIQLQEAERKEIATEIHEDFAQCLSAIKLRVESLLDGIYGQCPAGMIESLEPIVADVKQTIASIRRLAQKLHPMCLEAFGIASAIEWFCRETVLSHPGLMIQHHIRIEESLLSHSLKLTVFRIVEGMLAHAVRNGAEGMLNIYLQGVDQRL